MRIIKPITPVTTQLTNSSIAEPTTGETVWANGSSYSIGDEVISTTTHRKYRSVTDSNSGNNPDDEEFDLNGTGDNWQIVGSSLRYSMFDHTISTQSTDTTQLTFELTPNENVTAVAGFNISGATAINVSMDDNGTEVYSEDLMMRDESVVDDWWSYFFEPIVIIDRFILLDLPVYPNAVISVTVDGNTGDTVGVGEFVFGTQVNLGVTQAGIGWQGLDFSRKERNFDGSFSITQRRTADLFDYDFHYDTSRFGYLRQQLQGISSVATVFVGEAFGDTPNDGTAVFGYYKDVQLNIPNPTLSFGTIQVEGLV